MAATTITHNSPTPGSISWTAFNIAYGGQSYPVPAGSTGGKYVWWKYNGGAASGTGAPALYTGDVLPTLAAEDVLLFLNKKGIGVLVPATDILDGSLIVPESIYAGAIAADQVDARILSAGAVQAEHIAAGAVTTSSLSVGSVSENLVANGSFEDFTGGVLEGWTVVTQKNGTITPVSGVASSGTVSVQMAATTTAADLRLRQAPEKYFPVSNSSSRRWYFSARMGTGAAITKGAYLRVNWFNQAKVQLTGTAAYTDVLTNQAMTTTFLVYEGQLTPPADARYAGVEIIFTSPNVVTSLYVDEVNAYQVIVSARIADGAITAAKVNTTEFFANQGVIEKLTGRMATFLTNVDGSGNTSTVTGQGLRVTHTETDAAGKVISVQDVIKLGTFDDDHLSLFKNGAPVFSATADGDVTAQTLAVAAGITYKGQSLDEILYAMPRGHITAALRNTDSANNAVAGYGEWPYLRLDVELEEGRLYRVWTSPIRMGISPGYKASLRLRGATGATADGTSPTVNKVEVPAEGESRVLQEIWTPSVSPVRGRKTMCSFLITYETLRGSGAGESGVRATAQDPVRMEVEDIGPLQATGNGVWLEGPRPSTPSAPAPVPAPAKRTYEEEIGNLDRYTYDGNGNIYSWPYPRGAQGLSPAGYGNLKSIWTFESLAGRLAGAVVNEVWAYFYFNQWYNNAGGTARIVLHGNASRPGTYAGITSGVVATSGGWPAGSGRWIKIPESHYGGFASGTHKGFALEGDGSYETYGLATDCRLRIKYTK